MIKSIVNGIFPKGSQRRLEAGKIARKLRILGRRHPDVFYAEWLERSEPLLWSEPDKLAYQPLISIIVPVFNAPERYLLPMVYSVVNQQNYDNWELILVNASTDNNCRELTERCEQIDTRIKVLDIKSNEGIGGNTNHGIEAAKGEYIALLDHDDELAPQALYEVAKALQAKPRPEFVYSDEDKISERGDFRYDPFFKPEWSEYIFRQVNYLNHLSVIDKKLVNQLGGYRQEFEGAQDYDLFLRVIDKKPAIAHVPKILYHWRAADGSTAQNFEAKKNVRDAAILALQDHLKRNNQEGRIDHIDKQPGFYSIAYEVRANQKVAVLILPTDVTDQYIKLIDSVLHKTTTELKGQVFIADVGYEPEPPASLDLVKIDAVKAEDFIDAALAESQAELLVIINAAVRPMHWDWLDRLVGLISENPQIAVATPELIDKPSKTIVDAGYVIQGNNTVSLLQNLPIKSNTYFGNSVWGRKIDRTSNRVIALRREVYDKYFQDSHPKIDGNISSYKKIADDGFEVVVCMDVSMDFHGDLRLNLVPSPNFNLNLLDANRGISLPKTINVPPETD